MAWQRKYIDIDLTSGDITIKPVNESWAEDYLGARGLATKYLYELMDPKADALSPENVLIFATGPLTGTNASTASRYVVACKGALTNAIGCSNSGGKFGAALKHAGFDMLILRGRSPKPVYLTIEDEAITLHDAKEIWGTTVWHSDAWIKARHQNPEVKIAAIGKAGEEGVRYACVVNDLHRAAGRCGVGAVMGSKNLKAISAYGTQGVRAKRPAQMQKAVCHWNQVLADDPGRRQLSRYGTNAMMGSMQTFGGLPTHNFQAVQFEGARKVGVEGMMETRPNGHRNLLHNKACFACTIGCGRIAHIDPAHFSIKDRPQYLHASGGLEYETAYAFGPVVGVDDIDACTFAGYMMNEHGMDPISFGVTLAAAMELYEMGVIAQDETGGIPLNFGSAEALVVMSELTGLQQGFGKVLGLGSKRLCEKYGHPDLFMGVKGQEFAGYDSRALQGMGLGYATSNRGACHLKHDVFTEDMADQSGKGKAEPCKKTQDWVAFVDSTGLCLFPGSAFKEQTFSDFLSADLGVEWDEDRLRKTGERVFNLERLFNIEAGLTKADDTLPRRMLEAPAPSGVAEGKVNELSRMLPEYYSLRGWDADGVPTDETLSRLGISRRG